jgi:adenylate kinase
MKQSGILIFGPPASGKGKQGELLSENSNLYHFSTGDMFRELKEKQNLNPLEQNILNTMTIDDGNFVSDQQTLDLFKQKIQELQQYTLLLDGIPRTPIQVNPLNNLINIQALIYLQVPKEELIQRSLKRGRVDDTNEIIKKRLQIYKEITHPILEKYSKQIININGYQTREQVQKEILTKLKDSKLL